MNKLISIIIPALNEDKNLPIVVGAIDGVFKSLSGYEYEIIFVDDGSRDNTVNEMDRLSRQSPRIKFIAFSRNFGKEIATTAGINHAKGDAVMMMDADMQHPPELIPKFIEKWERGANIVVGIRVTNQKEGLIKKVGSYLYYKVLNTMTKAKVVPQSTDFRLISRNVVNEFNKFSERNRITRGLIDWLGFERDYIEFVANPRLYREASYTPLKLLSLAISSFVSLSMLPLRLAGYLGLIITILSGTAGVFILFEKYIFEDIWDLNITGSASLGVLILFLVGIILSCLGLIALYIGNIHVETTNRPIYVIKRSNLHENSHA